MRKLSRFAIAKVTGAGITAGALRRFAGLGPVIGR
jgi:hypothetical protein